MFKGLSMQLHRGLDFAEVHESVEDVVTLHGIERFPSVLVIKVGGYGLSVWSETGIHGAPLRVYLRCSLHRISTSDPGIILKTQGMPSLLVTGRREHRVVQRRPQGPSASRLPHHLLFGASRHLLRLWLCRQGAQRAAGGDDQWGF